MLIPEFNPRRSRALRWAAVALLSVAAAPAFGGFAGTDLYLPGAAHIPGPDGALWHSTVWITNPSTSDPVSVTVSFLKLNHSNPDPASFPETIGAGQTRKYDDIIETKFGETDTGGALHIVSTAPVVALIRTYNQGRPVDLPVPTNGQSFGGIPANFAAGPGQTTRLLGAIVGAPLFRYDFGMLETSGQPATIHVVLKDETGGVLASHDYSLRPFEYSQYMTDQLAPGVQSGNAILEETVVSPGGRAIFTASLIDNLSQDPTAIEMTYPAEVLAAPTDTAVVALAGAAALATTEIADRIDVIAAGAPLFGSYDETTKEWTIATALSPGQSLTARLQFRASDGTPQHFFNPLTTTAVAIAGQVQASGQTFAFQSVSFDVTVSGTNASAPALVAEGTGAVSSPAGSGTFVLHGVTLAKSSSSGYPSAGSVSVASGASSATVTFNGTEFASGTYTAGAVHRTFTVDLATGAVTFD